MKHSHVDIDKSVMVALNALGKDNKRYLYDQKILCINIMGSPGSGKTTLIEGLLKAGKVSDFAIIQGDLESDVDKKRLEKVGAYVYQINTHSGCHLNPQMVKDALEKMNMEGKKFLLVENVGNLVCPANVDIGQHVNLLTSSVTEGYDKPKKYPLIFFNADVLVVSKYDLAKAVEFDELSYMHDVKEVNGRATVFKLGKNDEEKFSALYKLLEEKRNQLLRLQ